MRCQTQVWSPRLNSFSSLASFKRSADSEHSRKRSIVRLEALVSGTGKEHFSFGMGVNLRPKDEVPVEKEQIFRMAQQEMEYRFDLFNKLTQTCFEKCIERKYKELELNIGENSCIDRCVAKYWQVTSIIGQMLGSSKPGM